MLSRSPHKTSPPFGLRGLKCSSELSTLGGVTALRVARATLSGGGVFAPDFEDVSFVRFGVGALAVTGNRSGRGFCFQEKSNAPGLLAKSDPLLPREV